MKIAKILIDICSNRDRYGQTMIDYLILQARFKERRELIKFRDMILSTKTIISTITTDDMLIDMIKSEKLLKAVLRAVINDR